jgi:hypothetical protein
MKKLLLIAAVASLSMPALASKARLSALGNADHLIDPQSTFENPSHLAWMGDFVTFEAGPTTATPTVTPGGRWSDLATQNNPNAEGGFVRSAGDAKYGAYLGRKSSFTDTVRRQFGFLTQENPIELQYAMKGPMNWGARLNYSKSDVKSLGQKQEAYGVGFGASTDAWEAFATVGLGSTAQGTTATTFDANGNDIIDAPDLNALAADPNAKFKGTAGFAVGGAYKMENIRLYGKYYQDGFKYEGTGALGGALNDLEVKASQISVGAIDHNKIEGGQWFYGVGYLMTSLKSSNGNIDRKSEASYLPFLLGVEYDAASWVTLRASATQNVLLGSTKYDDGPGPSTDESDTIRNNTRVAAGVGLRLNKWVLDGSWAAQTTGAVNTTNFLTNLGLTYMF